MTWVEEKHEKPGSTSTSCCQALSRKLADTDATLGTCPWKKAGEC